MTTNELISELRDQADVLGAGTECNLLREAADEIEGHKWISVKDRLPEQHAEKSELNNDVMTWEESDVVLVCYQGEIEFGKYITEVETFWQVCDIRVKNSIDYWMPLPEMPNQ